MPTGIRTLIQDRSLWWISGGISIVAGAVLTYAIELRDWKLAQIAAMTGVVLIMLGLALLARGFQNGFPSPGRVQGTKEEIRDKLLRRLVAVAGFGLGVILLYAFQYDHWTEGRVLSIASVGLIAAGAAWLTGSLLGFLFGIPHTREDLAQPDRYKPSTSLEQISDWLTKIIVGVSLTQLTNIPLSWASSHDTLHPE